MPPGTGVIAWLKGDVMVVNTSPIIELRSITKAYGATIANNDVNFRVERGTVHALLGENGAGKSTTMKILSGLVQPDRGSIHLNGEIAHFPSPASAHAAGIQTAFQELTLIPDLTILENMMLPRGAVNGLGILKSSHTASKVLAHFGVIGLDVDIHALASELTLATRQKIEIARALFRKPDILLLDEPTSALSGTDVDWLGDIIKKASAEGITVVFITHRMPEVRAFCETLTILRNGEHVKTGKVSEFTDDEVVELIIGRSVETAFPPRQDEGQIEWAAPVLTVHKLAAGRKLRDISFDLHPGEIIGIAGLQGMGQKELFMSLFGAERISSGTMILDGKELVLTSPTDALNPSVAIGLVPEERKTQGLFLKLSGAHNASLPVSKRFRKGLLLNEELELTATHKAFTDVEVDERAQYMAAGSFSGGNQQKIAIAKWFVAQSRILLLFDPTRGIDVGTKHQLYDLMRAFADEGGSILLHSTEIPELVHLSDRVGVIYEGEMVTWLEGSEITENGVMNAALGGVSKELSDLMDIAV